MVSTAVETALEDFLERSDFMRSGGVITDLDGTAVHEREGRIAIPDEVVRGLKQVRERGRPLVLNTLRFPLNVTHTFGREWYEISSEPVPLVSLNGGIIGQLDLGPDDMPRFVELVASPLASETITRTLDDIEAMVADGIEQILLFHYPRDWRQGEIIWTPVETRVAHVGEKYRSASLVVAEPLPKLRERLLSQDVCMIFVLIEAPADRLMAYQHARPSNFITAEGVDKLVGARLAADALGFALEESLGAGDTPMDRFLEGVGLGIHVGPMELEFRAKYGDLKLGNSAELGDLLFRLADLHRVRA